MKKNKYQEERKKYFLKKSLLFQILLSVSCLFLCIGYAKINDISLNIEGLSSAEKQKGIFVEEQNFEIRSPPDNPESRATTGRMIAKGSPIMLAVTIAVDSGAFCPWRRCR